MRSLTLALLLFSLLACGQQKMTLEKLQKAKWEKLADGVDHFSTKKSDLATDTNIVFLLRWAIKDGKATEFSDEEPDMLSAMVAEYARKYLAHPGEGWLRINYLEMMKNSFLDANIFLGKGYDSSQFSKDSTALFAIRGIVSASFVSKEEAKKRSLDVSGDDWSKVLNENPLPASIEIKLENKKWTKASLTALKSAIATQLGAEAEFSYSGYLLTEYEYVYFFEYKRK